MCDVCRKAWVGRWKGLVEQLCIGDLVCFYLGCADRSREVDDPVFVAVTEAEQSGLFDRGPQQPVEVSDRAPAWEEAPAGPVRTSRAGRISASYRSVPECAASRESMLSPTP